jgi:hypothetical protein
MAIKKMLIYCRMVTPSSPDSDDSDEDGADTTAHKWPKVYCVSILVDPCTPSQKKGGRRPRKLSKLSRDKKLVLITSNKMATIEETKDIIGQLFTNGWEDTDEYEIKYANDPDSSISASYGLRVNVVPSCRHRYGGSTCRQRLGV